MQREQALPEKTPKKLASGGAIRIARQFLRTVFVRVFCYSQMIRLARRAARNYSFGSLSGSEKRKLQRHPESKFAILCYHRVGTAGVPLYSRLPEKTFAAQMSYLKRNYRVVPLSQLCSELQEGRCVPTTMAVTFDDGYRDLYTFAFPVLQAYSIPATVYLIGRCMETGEAPWYDRIFLALENATGDFEVELQTRRVFRVRSSEERAAAAWEIISFLKSIPDSNRRAWCAEFRNRFPVNEDALSGRMLDWPQVRKMHKHGVHFGAHTMTHPAVSRLHSSQMAEELLESKHLLESGLDAPVEDFAYPFGKPEDFSGAAQDFLANSSFRSAVTTVEGFNSRGANLLELRRLQIGNGTSMADFSFELCRALLGSDRAKNGAENDRPANPVPGRLRECPEPVRQENA